MQGELEQRLNEEERKIKVFFLFFWEVPKANPRLVHATQAIYHQTKTPAYQNQCLFCFSLTDFEK